MTSSPGQNMLCEKYPDDLGLISKIQKYSTKDGPGIRTTVFFKGCPLSCLWCSNPELISPHPEILLNAAKCLGCGECIMACPQHAIMLKQGKAFTDRRLCRGCGRCVEVCPAGARELIGKAVGVEELVDKLLKDKVFYDVSKGGVTFSGGEAMVQHGFIARVAKRLKEHRIHVALDTAGYVPWSSFEEVLPFVDLVLYDIKALDEGIHEKCTGKKYGLILENALKIASVRIPMIIRLVIVPGYNDSEEDIKERLRFIQRLETVEQVDILPYHKLGVAKYERMGREYLLKDVKPPREQQITRIKSLVESYGYRATVGG